MSILSQQTTAVTGMTITAALWNDEFSNIYNDYNGGITNANIANAAGIVYSKLNLSGCIVNADVSAAAAIEEAKIAFNVTTGHSHDGSDSRQIKSLAQFERARYGVLITGTGMVPRWYNKTGLTLNLNKIFVYCDTAPTGASIIVDVNKNGTTIFTNQGNRPTITATNTSGTSGTPDIVALADGDYLTFDIDQVGSTIPGADLLIVTYF